MNLEEIKKLATLARIDMSEKEMVGMAHDFDSILAYVAQVQEATKFIKSDPKRRPTSGIKLENITREDVVTENPGEYANRLIEEMPDSDGRYLKVKQIL